MFPADTLKAYHDSTKTDFMWWGKNFVGPYFSIHSAFSTLYIVAWSLIEWPAFSTMGCMFLQFFFKWAVSKVTFVSIKEKYLIVNKGEPHKLDIWVVALIYPYLYIFPYGVWWTFQSSGMLKWRSWEYSLSWCTIMGVMKYCPSARINTSNLHHNGAWYPVFAFHMQSPLTNL